MPAHLSLLATRTAHLRYMQDSMKAGMLSSPLKIGSLQGGSFLGGDAAPWQAWGTALGGHLQ